MNTKDKAAAEAITVNTNMDGKTTESVFVAAWTTRGPIHKGVYIAIFDMGEDQPVPRVGVYNAKPQGCAACWKNEQELAAGDLIMLHIKNGNLELSTLHNPKIELENRRKRGRAA